MHFISIHPLSASFHWSGCNRFRRETQTSLCSGRLSCFFLIEPMFPDQRGNKIQWVWICLVISSQWDIFGKPSKEGPQEARTTLSDSSMQRSHWTTQQRKTISATSSGISFFWLLWEDSGDSCYVLGQDILPSLPAGGSGGAGVQQPHLCSYSVAYPHPWVNVCTNDCSVKRFIVLELDKVLYKCRPFTIKVKVGCRAVNRELSLLALLHYHHNRLEQHPYFCGWSSDQSVIPPVPP